MKKWPNSYSNNVIDRHTHKHTHARTHTYTHAHAHTHTHSLTHTYTHTHIHTHTHGHSDDFNRRECNALLFSLKMHTNENAMSMATVRNMLCHISSPPQLVFHVRSK